MEDEKKKDHPGESLVHNLHSVGHLVEAGEKLIGHEVTEHAKSAFGAFDVGYHLTGAAIEGAHGEGKAAADHLVSFSLALLEVAVPAIGEASHSWDMVADQLGHHGVHVLTTSEAAHAAVQGLGEAAGNAVYHVANPNPTPGEAFLQEHSHVSGGQIANASDHDKEQGIHTTDQHTASTAHDSGHAAPIVVEVNSLSDHVGDAGHDASHGVPTGADSSDQHMADAGHDVGHVAGE